MFKQALAVDVGVFFWLSFLHHHCVTWFFFCHAVLATQVVMDQFHNLCIIQNVCVRVYTSYL